MTSELIFQLALNGFVLGATIALMAIGFNLIFGILRIVNFWHGEAYMLGAVIGFYMVVRAGVNYFGAVVIAVLAIFAVGWLADKFIFRRFHGNLMGGAIAAIALSLGIVNVTWRVFGPIPRGIPSVVEGSVQVLGATVSQERLLIVGMSFAVCLALAWFIKFTRMGKAMRATQQDSEAALMQGISSNRICAMTFGIATGLAALAGVLVAPVFSVSPTMGMAPLMLTFIVVILGGMGSILGAFIAALIIGFQQSFTGAFLGPEYALTISFALAMVVLIARPTGLMGVAWEE